MTDNYFSDESKRELQTCHPLLQRLFYEVLKVMDCKIIQGRRGKVQQDKYYYSGKSKVKYPSSLHNANPSLAVDSAPSPLDWKDAKSFYYFAGIVKGIASMLGIPIRWGGDWDGDSDLNDQTFNDLCHFELDVRRMQK